MVASSSPGLQPGLESQRTADRIFDRTDIEVVFKTNKEYLDLLPLSKWTNQTVRGKILHDIINSICLLKLLNSFFLLENLSSRSSFSKIVGKCQSLIWFRSSTGIVTVETPSKQVKKHFRLLHAAPAYIDLGEFTPPVMTTKM